MSKALNWKRTSAGSEENVPSREDGKGTAPGQGRTWSVCRGEARGEEVETGQREEAGQREETGQANNEALSFCCEDFTF